MLAGCAVVRVTMSMRSNTRRRARTPIMVATLFSRSRQSTADRPSGKRITRCSTSLGRCCARSPLACWLVSFACRPLRRGAAGRLAVWTRHSRSAGKVGTATLVLSPWRFYEFGNANAQRSERLLDLAEEISPVVWILERADVQLQEFISVWVKFWELHT
jgi:hypothetical protein